MIKKHTTSVNAIMTSKKRDRNSTCTSPSLSYENHTKNDESVAKNEQCYSSGIAPSLCLSGIMIVISHHSRAPEW